MPISQMNKISQVETQLPPKIEKPPIEGDSTPSPEAPRVEFDRDRLSETVRQSAKLPPAMPVAPLSQGDLVSDQKFRKIESILEEDLGEVYFNLSQEKQHEFKTKGEETAIKIINLLNKPKVRIKKIISLIRDWLKIIPGINVFFLEQIVKIKADKIIDESNKKN